MKKASEDLASSNVKSVSLGTIDFGCSGKDLDQARENGGQVIWCAICLGKKLESMLTAYLFPIHATQCEKAKTFFISQVIRADILTYAAKKNLALKLINEERLLKRRNKDQFSKVLKDAMDYRNAFAHGDIAFHAEKGCVLEC